MPLYFCVDAGATRSRGRLYDASGSALANAESGPANASYDCEQAAASVLDLWARLNAAIGRDATHISETIFSIGGAGLYNPRARDAFVVRCPAFGTTLTMSDGYAALIGAGRGRPCALLTIGTGVAGHRLFEDGSSIQRDAWGWIIGDRGGGCWMGTRALRHAMEAQDGIAPPSALSKAVMERLGGVQGLFDGSLANLNPQRLAGFVPLILAEAQSGCPVAGEILSQAAGYLAALIGVLRCEDVPLYLNGGLAEVLKPLLVERIGRPVQKASADALAGCLLVARGEAPPERAVFG
jgi:glucosamine kinase